jgi:Protein of unknown function (DUF3102)
MPHNMVSATVPARLAEAVTRLKTTLYEISIAEGVIEAATAEVKEARHEIVILAMDAGDDLNAIKDEVGHGNFGPWLKKNFTHTARTATKYMELADGRDIIEAKIGTGSVLSITTALKLLRPSKGKKHPYSAETLAKLPPEERARLVANLGITITRGDVPTSVEDEIKQVAVDVAVSLERQAAAGDSAAAEQYLAKVRTKLTTGASPTRQVEEALAVIDHYDDMKNAPSWETRMAPGASLEGQWPRVQRRKTSTDPAPVAGAPPTSITKH